MLITLLSTVALALTSLVLYALSRRSRVQTVHAAHRALHRFSSLHDASTPISTKTAGPVHSLHNPVHPIFGRQNFHNGGLKRRDISEPAVQLASHFLELDELLPFWHNLFSGHVRPDFTSQDAGVCRFDFLSYSAVLTRSRSKTPELHSSVCLSW